MEEIDVAIVGGGLAGLAAAVAMRRVNPHLRIKVLESRPAPTGKYAGFVKLQPNGLKAAYAISPALGTALARVGMPEKRVLLHGEDGRLITRLDARQEHAAAEPAGVEDYDEEEDDVVLPSAAGAAAYGAEPDLGPQPTLDPVMLEGLREEAMLSEGKKKHRKHHKRSNPGNNGSSTPLASPRGVGGSGAAAAIPGIAAAAAAAAAGGSSSSTATPTKAAAGHQPHQHHREAAAERRRNLNVDEHSPNMIIGWYELERLLLNMLPQHTVEYEASFMKYNETDAGVVSIFEGLAYPLRSKVLLGCDGPFSGVRAQCVQDSEPAYDQTVKWVGRLDGHQVSTTPLDFCAWWLKKGQVFVSHPLANGDVGWEAVVSEQELQAAGYKYDESVGRALPIGREAELKQQGKLEELPPSQALMDVFKAWPKAVDQMVRYSAPESVLESGVFVRSAADMPPSMGKGRVAIMGEAAHPLRPTGQDANMAFEDAAELAAFVQEYGLGKEALRRYDTARRPRWRHVMQLTAAQGATTTTGIGLSQGLLEYTADLYRRDFVSLGKHHHLEALQRAARASRGPLARLRRFATKLVITGVLTSAVLVAAAIGLPLSDVEREEMRTAVARKEADRLQTKEREEEEEAEIKAGRRGRVVVRRAVRGTGNTVRPVWNLLKRGALRTGDAVKRATQTVAETPVGHVAGHEVHVAKKFVSHKAEDATNVAIDAAEGVAKRTIKHRITKALGVF